MSKTIKSVMLIDDNPNDNFFHKRIINKFNPEIIVIEKDSALDALAYLKSIETQDNLKPDLIFLDINMPAMNGWEFLEEYDKLDKQMQSRVMIIMLTTSDNPDDIIKAKGYKYVSDFISKPLTKELLEDIQNRLFK
jgi:response regulator RpfG family c-di-GMP phosphodiesterase